MNAQHSEPSLRLDQPSQRGLPSSQARALGAALRGADAGLRIALGAGWIALAVLGPAGPSPLGTSPLALARLAIGVIGAATLAGFGPRVVTTSGLMLSLGLAGVGFGTGSAAAGFATLLVAAATRVVLQLGPAGPWLSRTRHLERRRVCALAKTAFARTRAAEAGGDLRLREVALAEAGDAYERAGRLLRELRTRGAEPTTVVAAASALAGALARALRPLPHLRRRVEDALAASLKSNAGS